ncbi:Arginine--tRNA ligase [Dictyocoela muelleri]|nr:Arginine--tRNA ligase [Dictyocoela muelleri]
MIPTIIENLSKKFAKELNYSEQAIKDSLYISKDISDHDLSFQVAKLTSKSDEIKTIYEKVISIKNKSELPEITSFELFNNIIKIKLNKKRYINEIYNQINSEGMNFGVNNRGKGKKVIVEFSSPNIAKIFHAGHLRTTIIGNFIRNIFKASGYEVIAINYLGDWGKQFGLLGVGYERYGNESLLKENPLKHLYDVYVKINKDKELEKEGGDEKNKSIDQMAKEYFKKLENGESAQYELWKKFRELSIEKYKELYSRMHITFDIYSGESQYGEMGKEIVMNDKNIVTDKDGSKYFDLGDLGKFCVIKNDGTSLYSTRDIAAAVERVEKYKAEKIYYVVACQQNHYFKQLFSVLAQMGYNDKFVHVSYGMVDDMSTRKGKVVFLEDIIEESKKAMHATMMKNSEKYEQIEDKEATIEELALSAIIIQDFKAKRIKNYAFDMKRNTNTEGETGPHLQYTHCRLQSIFNKNLDVVPEIHLDCYTEENLELFFYLMRYPMVVEECLESFEPSKMVTYLFKLCKCVNKMFSKYRVMNEVKQMASARLAMFESAKIVLANGMRILGMVPLMRM